MKQKNWKAYEDMKLMLVDMTNDQLADHSLTAIARRHTEDVTFLDRLKAIPTGGFAEQDILSHELLTRVLQQRLSDYELKEYEMPVDQMNGVHTPSAVSANFSGSLGQARATVNAPVCHLHIPT